MNLKTLKHQHVTYQYIKTKQFKTRVLTVRFLRDLTRVNTNANHVLVGMMKAKNAITKTRKAHIKALDTLYGSSFYAHVTKIGTKHVTQFTMVFPDQKYIKDSHFFHDVIDFFKTSLFNVALDKATFDEEKQFLEDYFKSQYTNKTRYARNQHHKHVYQDYPFNQNPLGDEESLPQLTLDDVEKSYHEMIDESQIYISYIGNDDSETVHNVLLKDLNLKSVDAPLEMIYPFEFTPLKAVKESMKVTQNRLFLSFISNTYLTHENYMTMLVFNSLFGEGSDSLLFRSVREEASLVYYIYSNYATMTGLVHVASGLDKNNVEEGKKRIFEVLKAIQEGNFSLEDLELAKTQLVSSLKQSYDSVLSLSYKAMMNELFNLSFNEKEIISKIQCIQKEDVVKISKQLTFMFEYQLGGFDENILS